MATLNTTAKTSRAGGRFRLPDIPEKHPDDMTTSKHLAQNGNMHHLLLHLGSRETTIVSGERYVCAAQGATIRYPDLLVALSADPDQYEASNGYIVSEQGKPPDLVLEIASRRTGSVDTGEKRRYYEELGVGEYWRFDETGEYHGARLGGDILVEGRYEPVPIEELDGGILQGYSAVLNLNLRWEDGELVFHDPATNAPIATFESERSARLSAEARADLEREARMAAESRAAELEAELRQLRGE